MPDLGLNWRVRRVLGEHHVCFFAAISATVSTTSTARSFNAAGASERGARANSKPKVTNGVSMFSDPARQAKTMILEKDGLAGDSSNRHKNPALKILRVGEQEQSAVFIFFLERARAGFPSNVASQQPRKLGGLIDLGPRGGVPTQRFGLTIAGRSLARVNTRSSSATAKCGTSNNLVRPANWKLRTV